MAGPELVRVDSGFFVALFNQRDRYHASARQLEEWLDLVPIVLTWPILYETMNTRLARRPEILAKFGAIARSPETVLLDDSPYREGSFAAVLAQDAASVRLSLVDAVLCRIIEDANVPISAMLTFNVRDFVGVCHRHNVELLNASRVRGGYASEDTVVGACKRGRRVSSESGAVVISVQSVRSGGWHCLARRSTQSDAGTIRPSGVAPPTRAPRIFALGGIADGIADARTGRKCHDLLGGSVGLFDEDVGPREFLPHLAA